MNKKFLLGAVMLTSLIASPVFAETSGTTTTTMPETPKVKVAVDYSCVQTAVDVRETTIATAFTAFSTAESAALAARKSALHDAWGMTSAKERSAARNKAWSDFKTVNRAAFKALRTANKDAWGAFKTASKSCHAPVAESHGEEGVGSLGL